MNYKYCKRCQKIYEFNGNQFCADCINQIDDYVVKIRDYIAENPNANIFMLRDELEIPEKDILYLIKENRIEVSEKEAESISRQCAKCGKPVLGERYCNDCKNEIAATMLQATQTLQAKMRNADNRKAGVLNTIHQKEK